MGYHQGLLSAVHGLTSDILTLAMDRTEFPPAAAVTPSGRHRRAGQWLLHVRRLMGLMLAQGTRPAAGWTGRTDGARAPPAPQPQRLAQASPSLCLLAVLF